MSVVRIAWALCAVLAYVLLCGAMARRHRRQQEEARAQAQSLLPATPGVPAWCVVHASQTGQAEALALQTAQALHSAGVPVRLLGLGELTREDLRQTQRLLCIASTYGEGDPPDSAMAFTRELMADAALELGHLHVGLLALGDSSYANYCGFGRALDQWFGTRGAQALFERIDVDKHDADALQRWRQHLLHLAGTNDLPDWEAPALQAWQLRARRHLNPGSAGEGVFHLELAPPPGEPLPDWQAGDLVQVEVPTAPGAPRDYSIASVPQDGALHLLVRVARRTDGSPGLASDWLCREAEVGAEVRLRVRAHTGFRIGDNTLRPLVLIGNGTGLAGLRAHMRARLAAAGQADLVEPGARPAAVPPMWLLFGERQSHCDAYYADEIKAWDRQAWLTCVDRVYSRDQAERRYVQHVLAESAGRLRVWVQGGAAIYVCGSLQGMAAEVDRVLRDILGEAGLDQLTAEGRYRRDVY